ncbi:hypothetical protein HRM2_14210 [Desulforapulum autotrophicum HRM2]|uniref:AdoMet activation domain-containing protein n=1 Tax=Desulforapulum autotrophicum (strain ATCC 43914 / DSM 3382 / VKM B-1955 / HRM2) TaxID=177437 RepID=C0Q9G6_DESAH|nr:hypothetical protein [Desulforapulum autotrophicum]ACN14530.1 hypothetical protein HRM2_14210 [Desulforapulum autotrophicum HRM2]
MKEQQIAIEEIDCRQVTKALGYGKKNPPSKGFLQRVEKLIEAAPKHVYSGYVDRKIKAMEKGLVRTDVGTIASPCFGSLATQAEKVIFGLVTAGPEMDQFLADCRDTVDAMVVDSIGSIVVEQGVEILRNIVAEALGQYVSLPFSPGYCDYPLTEQEMIFKPFGDAPLGIRYHPVSFMMTPVKTISFIMATGPFPLDTNPCSLCRLETCQMRRTA